MTVNLEDYAIIPFLSALNLPKP